MTSSTHGLPAKGWISAVEMLPHLPIKRSTLWKWAKDGRFPTPTKIGRLTRWRTEDVIKWLNQFSGGVHE